MGLIEFNTLIPHASCGGGSTDLCDEIDRFYAENPIVKCDVSGCSPSNNGTWTYGDDNTLACNTSTISDEGDGDAPVFRSWQTVSGGGATKYWGVDVEEGAPFGQESVYGFTSACSVLAALATLRGGGTVDLPLAFNSGCGGGASFELYLP